MTQPFSVPPPPPPSPGSDPAGVESAAEPEEPGVGPDAGAGAPADVDIRIDFHGRSLLIRRPAPEQLLIWRRVLLKLRAANPETWDNDRLLQLLEKARRIVDSILGDEDDVEWLDDAMLSGEVDLSDVLSIIPLAVEAIANSAGGNERHPAGVSYRVTRNPGGGRR